MKLPVNRSAEIEALLLGRPEALANAVRARLADFRPSVMFAAERVGRGPQRVGRIGRWLGRTVTEPVLSPLASKFGGIPYCERSDELGEHHFVGQINFAEVAQALEAQGQPLPDDMPRQGLLAFDFDKRSSLFVDAGRTRWYKTPEMSKACCPPLVHQFGKYEASLSFRGSWSLQSLNWFDGLKTDHELWEWMNELEIEGVDEDMHRDHKLFGHMNEALNEHDGWEAHSQRHDAIEDYRLVWRLTHDNMAGFGFGTTWFYIIIHRDNLRIGAFDRAIVTAANA
jgi:Domain of unknown function (DUF1963)